MDEFNKLLLKIKEDIRLTRDGWEADDVDTMCRYIYDKMQEEIRYKDIEIFDLKSDLIRYKADKGWFL